MKPEDRWSRISLRDVGGRCCAEVVRGGTRDRCYRSGRYEGRCYQHAADADGLMAAQRDLEEALQELAREVATQHLLPHATLARLRAAFRNMEAAESRERA